METYPRFGLPWSPHLLEFPFGLLIKRQPWERIINHWVRGIDFGFFKHGSELKGFIGFFFFFGFACLLGVFIESSIKRTWGKEIKYF